MNNIIKTVEIIFRNLDYINIPQHYFNELDICDIRTNIFRVAANSIRKITTAENIRFELCEQTNTDALMFEGDVHDVEFEHKTLFERFKKNDITRIYVYYRDGTKDEIDVCWSDEDDYTNYWQTTKINSDGTLAIEITKTSD